MRISDSERQRAVEELRRHLAAGRIDLDEFSGRTEKALEAETLEDLDKLLSDLPMLRIADPVGSKTRSGSAMALPASDRDRSVARRPMSRRPAVVAAVTIAVVAGAVVLAIASSWVAAAALLIGWLAGMLQGRVRG